MCPCTRWSSIPAPRGDVVNLLPDQIFAYLRRQAEDGVDFMTIHAGLTLRAIDKLRKRPRTAGIVSRGSLLTAWMLHNKNEIRFSNISTGFGHCP